MVHQGEYFSLVPHIYSNYTADIQFSRYHNTQTKHHAAWLMIRALQNFVLKVKMLIIQNSFHDI